ncbi:MAG: glycosyltransferase family 4 protein [Bryobacteraceae bacterium]
MNVLVWNSWITPAGGMERVALSIANGLADRGCGVTLAGPYESVPLLRQAINPKVDFVQCDFSRSAKSIFENALFLRRLVRDRSIDVISAHGSLFPLLPARVPVAWTEHGPRYGHGKIMSGPKTLPWMAVRSKLRRGDWILVGCSRFVCQHVGAQLELPESSMAVIYNGVPKAEALSSLPPPEWNQPARIGLLGRVEPEKYPGDIFILDEELQRRGVPCEWHIFGEGSLSGEMRRRTAGHPRIKMRGLASSGAEALAQMDAMVFLSHGEMEGMPTVLLEARLARRPVVAWNVTANPESVGPLDKLVEPFDLVSFAGALESVIRDKLVPPPVGDEISYDRMVDEYHRLLASMTRRSVGAVERTMLGADS